VDGNRKSLNDELIEKGFAKPYKKDNKRDLKKSKDKKESDNNG